MKTQDKKEIIIKLLNEGIKYCKKHKIINDEYNNLVKMKNVVLNNELTEQELNNYYEWF